jgi:AraC family transcriptional regulator, carnitine catabolism transcriptional activator
MKPVRRSTKCGYDVEPCRPSDRHSVSRVGILVLPHHSHLGLSLLIEPLAIANWLTQSGLYTWTTLSLDGQPVLATNGMSILTEALPEQAGRYSTIFVVASFEAKDHAKNLKLRMWLQRERAFGAQIGGIETGTEILAAASLLDGRCAAVHWDNLEGFQETYPKAKASTQLFTLDPRIITCAGAFAISDMMLAWIAETHGQKLATEIVDHLLHPRMRDSVDGQLTVADEVSARASEQVTGAIRLMQQSLTTPLSCEEIATAVGLSKRQLERHFKQYTASAPLQYYVSLRVATAHKLLQQTDLSVSQVAAASGFESLEHFSRVYKARFGIPPSMDRRQTLTAPVMRHAARPPIRGSTSAQPHWGGRP